MTDEERNEAERVGFVVLTHELLEEKIYMAVDAIGSFSCNTSLVDPRTYISSQEDNQLACVRETPAEIIAAIARVRGLQPIRNLEEISKISGAMLEAGSRALFSCSAADLSPAAVKALESTFEAMLTEYQR